MKTLKELQEAFAAARDAYQAAATAIQEAAEDIAADDLAALTATFDATEVAFTKAEDDLELFERTESAKKIALPDFDSEDEGKAEIKVTKEPLTYEQFSPNSIFRDIAHAKDGDPAAVARLSRHRAEIAVEQPDKFDLSSTDSAGGYLVAPIWLQDLFADYRRADRVTANLIGSRPLPPNTDSINIPKMTGGVTTAAVADNSAVSETDATFGTVAADVKTIAGMQDVSQQLLDRSVPGIDEIIFADLARSYNGVLDTAVLNSSTSNNKGLAQVSSINTVTYTDASPTAAEFLPKVADAIQQIHSGLYRSATHILMHPRRWGWLLAGADTTTRPLINAYFPQNAAGTSDGVIAEGLVGSIQGLPVYADAYIPTTNGASTLEDPVIVISKPDLLLWEDQSGPYLGTFPDVGSGTLTVRFRLHNYYAQCHERQPEAICVISGSGLQTPTF